MKQNYRSLSDRARSSGRLTRIISIVITDTEVVQDAGPKVIYVHEDSEEGMTMDMVDGFMHILAIGRTTVHPKPWLLKM